MKKIFISIFIVLSIVIINFFILLYFIWTCDYSHSKEIKYESYQNRLEVFKKYQDNLEEIVDYFYKNEINSIVYDYNYQCSVKEKTVKISNNIFLCTNQRDQEEKIYEIKETIEKVIKDGKIRKVIITKNQASDQIITINFYLMSSLNGEIYYSYCYDYNTCPLKEEVIENKRGKYISNKITDNWFSIYNSIPKI